MKLSEWLDEYRTFPHDEATRPEPEIDDWHEQPLLAADDRVRDNRPRWRERAARVGYARMTGL